jgi:chromosome segregation ATPase
VIDYLLSPFKLDDLKDRMIESLEKDLMDARENAAAAREHAATARENATTIREVLASTAQARDRATRRADIAERQVKQLRAEVQTFYHAF